MRLLIAFIFLVIGTSGFSQYDMDVTLTNGDKISGDFKWKKRKLVNRTTKEVIHFDSIDNFSTKFEDFTNHYYVVYYAFNGNIKIAKQALGYKIYTGKTIDMFYINFGNYVRDTPHKMTHDTRVEFFVRRRGEKYVYSLGCRDGVGCDGIKERLREFFNDCPELITRIESSGIDIKNTPGVVKLYERLCQK